MQSVLANSEKHLKCATDIYYAKGKPGRLSGKAATHLPIIEIEKVGDKATVRVVTAHK